MVVLWNLILNGNLIVLPEKEYVLIESQFQCYNFRNESLFTFEIRIGSVVCFLMFLLDSVCCLLLTVVLSNLRNCSTHSIHLHKICYVTKCTRAKCNIIVIIIITLAIIKLNLQNRVGTF